MVAWIGGGSGQCMTNRADRSTSRGRPGFGRHINALSMATSRPQFLVVSQNLDSCDFSLCIYVHSKSAVARYLLGTFVTMDILA